MPKTKQTQSTKINLCGCCMARLYRRTELVSATFEVVRVQTIYRRRKPNRRGWARWKQVKTYTMSDWFMLHYHERLSAWTDFNAAGTGNIIHPFRFQRLIVSFCIINGNIWIWIEKCQKDQLTRISSFDWPSMDEEFHISPWVRPSGALDSFRVESPSIPRTPFGVGRIPKTSGKHQQSLSRASVRNL